MRSKSRLNFEIPITPLIFELEHRSEAQNVGNLTGYRLVTLNFRFDFRFKKLSGPQNGGHLENFEIFEIEFILTSVRKDGHKLYLKGTFDFIDVTGDVTA